MVWHDQNSYVAPHFDYLDLRNKLVQLMVQSISHDCDANVDVRAPHDNKKINVAPHFNCHKLRNAMVPLMVLLAWCATHVSANDIKKPKSHVAPHFNCLDLKNEIVPFLLLIPLPVLHLILIILTKQIQWYHLWCYWHHMILILVPLISHDQKIHVHILLIILI